MTVRGLVSGCLAVAAVSVTAVLATGSGDDGHRLELLVPEAAGVIEGNAVKAAGRQVGEVTGTQATRDGRARISLRIDDAAWPVPKDSTLALRLNGTIKFSDRVIDLHLGRATTAYRDGEAFDPSRFEVPTEFDQLFGIFDARTRKDLRATLDTAGAAIGEAGEPMADALPPAAPAVTEADRALADLGADDRALQTLVRSTDRVLDAVDRAQPGIRQLLEGADRTFRAFAADTRQLQAALTDFPPTLASARTTLARARPTLERVSDLSGRLAPGVREARRTVGPLRRVLAAVEDVGPDATATLASVRRATPHLNPLLAKTTDVLPMLTSIGRQAREQLACIRPFGPELAGFATAWGPGFFGLGDAKDKYLRAVVNVTMPPNVTPVSMGHLNRLVPAWKSAFPRPPGQLVHQPWFIEECGLGPETVDPQRDMEAFDWDPLSKNLLKIQPGPPEEAPGTERGPRGRRGGGR